MNKPHSFCLNGGTSTIPLCFFLLIIFFPGAPLAGAQAVNNNNNQEDTYYNRVSPSMAIIIVILIAALFLMGFFSIYIRHCADSPSNSIRNIAGGAGRSRRGQRGLDPSVIETFPTLEYSVVKIHKIGKGALECAVCLNEFEQTEKLRLIPKCDHVFHPECIDEWLGSHTTCPVCRANLVPQPGESVHGIPLQIAETQDDIEAQNDAVEHVTEQQNADAAGGESKEPEVIGLNQTLNRNRTRGSRSGRSRRFPRSHSTGHSLVQPGEDTERFTLRLPVEVRNKILLNPELHRARSLVMLPRESSSRRGYRTGGDGSNRGRASSRTLDRGFKSDRWVFTMAPPFLVRASSIRSPRIANSAGEGTSATTAATAAAAVESPRRPPV